MGGLLDGLPPMLVEFTPTWLRDRGVDPVTVVEDARPELGYQVGVLEVLESGADAAEVVAVADGQPYSYTNLVLARPTSRWTTAGERLASRYLPAESSVHSAYQRWYRRRRLRYVLASLFRAGTRHRSKRRGMCRVVAIEPQSAVASRLANRFTHDGAVVAVSIAVAAAEGEVDLHHADSSSDMHQHRRAGWEQR